MPKPRLPKVRSWRARGAHAFIGQDENVTIEKEQLHSENLRHAEFFKCLADSWKTGYCDEDDSNAGGKDRIGRKPRQSRIVIAAIIAAVVGLQFGSLSTAGEMSASAMCMIELPFAERLLPTSQRIEQFVFVRNPYDRHVRFVDEVRCLC